MTILVVDDSILICSIIQNALTKQDIDVLTVHTGREALMTAEEAVPDLILLDVVLPDIDGYLVCSHLKKHSLLKEIPVIFITSNNETHHVVTAFQAGASDYIMKPFSLEELYARVLSHLRAKQMRDELMVANSQLTNANRKLEEALKQNRILATKDPLTNLYNRRYLMDCLAAWYKRSRLPDMEESVETVFLFITDIDDFKQINDHYGHTAGDSVICRIAAIIQECSGRRAIVGRLGGEEFVTILYNSTHEEAWLTGQSICEKTAAWKFFHKNTSFFSSVTVGIAPVDPSVSIETNLERADHALYRGKREGKNRCILEE